MFFSLAARCGILSSLVGQPFHSIVSHNVMGFNSELNIYQHPIVGI